jgi:XTP/dITP diphosphohydrolase
MEKEIILASFNKNKAFEIGKIMLPVRVRCLADFGVDIDFDAVEDGETYKENALKKMLAAAARVDGIIAADDSGLEVEALGGRPGLLSARYGGADISDMRRCMLLLDEMKNIPEGQRRAKFICIVAARFPDGSHRFFDGELPGTITFEPRGASGFGYDPVVFLPDRGLTVAQLEYEEKNRISHRAQAFLKLRKELIGE